MRVHEDAATGALDEVTGLALRQASEAAIADLGASLVTVSLWRGPTRDLVRVYSSRPDVYRPRGVSRELGAEWVRRCVIDRKSFVAHGDELDSDAFEHHDVLRTLHLGAAINAVIVSSGAFLGCLNILGPPGSFDEETALAQAETLAAALEEPLLTLGRTNDWSG